MKHSPQLASKIRYTCAWSRRGFHQTGSITFRSLAIAVLEYLPWKQVILMVARKVAAKYKFDWPEWFETELE